MDNLYAKHKFDPAVETEPDSPDDAFPASPSGDDHQDEWDTYLMPPYSVQGYGHGYGYGYGPTQGETTQGEITQLTPPPPEEASLHRDEREGRGQPPDRFSPSGRRRR